MVKRRIDVQIPRAFLVTLGQMHNVRIRYEQCHLPEHLGPELHSGNQLRTSVGLSVSKALPEVDTTPPTG